MQEWANLPTASGGLDANGVPLWDYTTNLPAGVTAPNQSLIPIQIKRARHNYYFILLDRSLGVHNVFYTNYLLSYSNSNLDALGVSKAAPVSYSRQQAISILNRDILRVRAANAKGAACDYSSR